MYAYACVYVYEHIQLYGSMAAKSDGAELHRNLHLKVACTQFALARTWFLRSTVFSTSGTA